MPLINPPPLGGSVSVYDIDQGHRLVKTIPTASNVNDVKGVAVSAAWRKLNVAYRTRSGVGMILLSGGPRRCDVVE